MDDCSTTQVNIIRQDSVVKIIRQNQILKLVYAAGPRGPVGPIGPTGQGVPPGGSTHQVLTKTSDSDFATDWETPAPAGVTSVNGQTGAVSLTTDNIPQGTTNKYFTAAAAIIAVGAALLSPLTYDGTNIGIQQASASQNGYISSTDWNTFNNKQANITAGTTAQYYRGDKTFATLDTNVVPENGNLYFTNARADARITAQKGVANGIAPLGADTKIPSSYLPAIAITETYVVNSQAAMLALSQADVGDIAVRTDISETFILTAAPPSTLANWQQLLSPPNAVLSVNGFTGAITLTTTNIAEGTNQYFTAARSRSSISAGTGISYNSTSGVITNTSTATIGGTINPNQIAFGSAADTIIGTDDATLDTNGNATFAGVVTGNRGVFGYDNGYAGNFGGTGFITASFVGLDGGSNRAAILFEGSFGNTGNPSPIVEFGSDISADGGYDLYFYSSAFSFKMLQADPQNDEYFFGHDGFVYLNMDGSAFTGYSNGDINFADNRGGGGGSTNFNSELFVVYNPDSNWPSGLLQINHNLGVVRLGDWDTDVNGTSITIDDGATEITVNASSDINFNTLQATFSGALTVNGVGNFGSNLQLGESANIILGTSIGTKIGTAANQKLAFHNATPIVQSLATTDLGVVLI